MSSHLSNVRYGYFDALRGLTMILVVFSHIFYFSIHLTPTINLFFCTFRMPLFFFVSGFFAYKTCDVWNRKKLTDILTRKVQVQIVGASICCLLYSVFINSSLPSVKSIIYASNEYWFTYILFRLFVIYVTIVLIAKRWGGRRTFWIITGVFSLLCIVFHHVYPSLQLPRFVNGIIKLIVPRTFYYYPYFALGMLARDQLGYFEKILSNNYVKVFPALFVIGVWGAIMLGYLPKLTTGISYGYKSAWAYPLGICTLLLLIQFFFANRFKLDRDTRFNRSLKFIGRRTLDIYFFHYFFLPNLKFLKPYLVGANALSAQLIIGLGASMIVVGFSLFVGRLVRMSPILAKWLLGVRIQNREPGDSSSAPTLSQGL